MRKKYQRLKIKDQKYKKILEPRTSNLEPISGQIVLILVLLSVVGLTVGLSLISRTITDIRISHQIEESSRAFSAAEAGIETALRGADAGETGNLTFSGAEASYKVEMLGGTSSVYTFSVTELGKMQTLWFMEHKTDGSGKLNENAGSNYKISTTPTSNFPLDICWGSGSTNNSAMVMTLIYKDIDGNYKIAKAAYDPDATRRFINKFTAADGPGNYCDSSFLYKKTINDYDSGVFWDGLTLAANAKLIALSLQPVYQATAIAVKPDPSANLPYQGKQIISLGTTTTGIVRRIQVTQEFSLLPEIFNFSFCTE